MSDALAKCRQLLADIESGSPFPCDVCFMDTNGCFVTFNGNVLPADFVGRLSEHVALLESRESEELGEGGENTDEEPPDDRFDFNLPEGLTMSQYGVILGVILEARAYGELEGIKKASEITNQSTAAQLVGRLYRLMCNSEPSACLDASYRNVWSEEARAITEIVHKLGWENA